MYVLGSGLQLRHWLVLFEVALMENIARTLSFITDSMPTGICCSQLEKTNGIQ